MEDDSKMNKVKLKANGVKQLFMMAVMKDNIYQSGHGLTNKLR